MGGIVVVGSLNVDLTIEVGRLPAPGETVIGSGSSVGLGGKGANQAAAAAALGGTVAMVGRVGDDDGGRELVGDLRERGVDVDEVVVTDGARTGSATIAVDGKGENLIVVDPGANSAVTSGDVRVRRVEEADVVLAQLEIPMEAVSAAAAHARGLFLLNPAPARELPAELLERVDVLVPNQAELALLSGAEPPETLEATKELVTGLLGGARVVVTLGAEGALVHEPGGGFTHVTAPEVEPVDTTGAGDCFCGALAVELTRGASLVASTRLAVAAAALSTTAAGARGRLPTRDEVETAAGSGA
jgi:ribokinase